MKQQKLADFPAPNEGNSFQVSPISDNRLETSSRFGSTASLVEPIDFSAYPTNKKKNIETLRAKGQFWTPNWIAESMVSYLFAGGKKTVFDPCVGAGAFFQAARNVSNSLQKEIVLEGTETDPNALREAIRNGVSRKDIFKVEIRDFLLDSPQKKFEGIVANPPYIRHHRISMEVKEKLRSYALRMVGERIDGRAGYHVYFLMKGLELMDDNGRLVFILPADICEGKFAPILWRWITENYCLDAVITFSREATPFPNQDTNPLIVMIRKAAPKPSFIWAQCKKSGTDELTRWILSGFKLAPKNDIVIHERTVEEALRTGLSRTPQKEIQEGRPLKDFAKVTRGIATGANSFFFLTREKARTLGIPNDFLLPAIGKTRDVEGTEITEQTLEKIVLKGAPTLLLSLDGKDMRDFPLVVRAYLKKGEEEGVHKKILISTRKPWYKMEVREVPPFLFSYLGRKNTRFLRNLAGVVPLTGFLCIYPHKHSQEHIYKLEKALNHPKTLDNLKLVGKTYGGGAIKVEPRGLDMLILPLSVLHEVGLD